MKICRYLMRGASSSDSASPRYGLIEGENVTEISGPPWAEWSRGSRSSRLADVRLLAPVEPSKIVCIGPNYAAHAAEMGNEVPKEPVMFLKPPSSIVSPEEAIVLTKYSQRVEHEGELALVIGQGWRAGARVRGETRGGAASGVWACRSSGGAPGRVTRDTASCFG